MVGVVAVDPNPDPNDILDPATVVAGAVVVEPNPEPKLIDCVLVVVSVVPNPDPKLMLCA